MNNMNFGLKCNKLDFTALLDTGTAAGVPLTVVWIGQADIPGSRLIQSDFALLFYCASVVSTGTQ